MKNNIKKIKAALRNKAIEVAIFDGNNYTKDIPQQKFVPLEDALKAIDDFELLMVSPPCENFSGSKRKTDPNNRGQEIRG